jgi:hypothetical protein
MLCVMLVKQTGFMKRKKSISTGPDLGAADVCKLEQIICYPASTVHISLPALANYRIRSKEYGTNLNHYVETNF